MTGANHLDAVGGIASLLFVPGSTPERFGKALAADTDLVCIDLEDAVPLAGKDAARDAGLAAAFTARLAIRINAVATRAGVADLLALADTSARPAALLVPMVESPDELRIVRAVAGDIPLIPLIETPLGLRRAAAIAAMPGVAAMMFGGGDMAGTLGVEIAWEPLFAARGAFLLACAEAGVPAIDVPFLALDDSDGLAEESRRAKALGFQAKAAIHPAQLTAINEAFRPGAALVEEAEAARDAFLSAGGGAIRFKGRMLEAPVMRRYDRILAMHQMRKNQDA